eukprot:4738318-Alexandrium_andersonii.AAC.1
MGPPRDRPPALREARQLLDDQGPPLHQYRAPDQGPPLCQRQAGSRPHRLSKISDAPGGEADLEVREFGRSQ